jgi:hypothetical protein
MSKEIVQSSSRNVRSPSKRKTPKADDVSAQASAKKNGHAAVPSNGNGSGSNGTKNGTHRTKRSSLTDRDTMMRNAVGGTVPVTEWDRLSAPSRAEVENLVEVLKSVKQGDFSVRFDYEKSGVLSRAGEILNDIIGFNEHLSGELLRVGKIVGQEGKMHERASVGAPTSWRRRTRSRASSPPSREETSRRR